MVIEIDSMVVRFGEDQNIEQSPTTIAYSVKPENPQIIESDDPIAIIGILGFVGVVGGLVALSSVNRKK